jgi:hypothetical protein
VNQDPSAGTLIAVVRPEFAVLGKPIAIGAAMDTTIVGKDCLFEATQVIFDGNSILSNFLDSTRFATVSEFRNGCLDEPGQSQLQRHAYYVEEAGRTDDHLISLSVRRTLIPPGGKGHPEILTFHYDSAHQRLIPFPELFRLAPDRLYPLLRRLVLEKIDQDGLLEDAERVLFDDGKQQNEEVLSAGLVTAEGLMFSFEPAQCHQLYWATPIEVTLPWDTQL